MTQSADNLVWVDLEMTGLDTMNDSIIEIATIITDSQLNILAQGPVVAIHMDDSTIAAMDEWNSKTHSQTGLIERIRKSKYTSSDAERMTLEFLQRFIPANASPMCGNSICQDRRFMARLMPGLEAYFHYRNLDVSTLKILTGKWAPAGQQFQKDSRHVALEDIRDSINELKFYREQYFNI